MKIVETSVVNLGHAYALAKAKQTSKLIRHLYEAAKDSGFHYCSEIEWAYKELAAHIESQWKTFDDDSRFRKFLIVIKLTPDCVREIINAVMSHSSMPYNLPDSGPTKRDLCALVYYCAFMKSRA